MKCFLILHLNARIFQCMKRKFVYIEKCYNNFKFKQNCPFLEVLFLKKLRNSPIQYHVTLTIE